MLLVPRGVQASIHRSNTVSGESKLEDAWMASHQLLLLVSNVALLCLFRCLFSLSLSLSLFLSVDSTNNYSQEYII